MADVFDDDKLENASPRRRRPPKSKSSKKKDMRARVLADFRAKVERLEDGTLKSAMRRLMDPSHEVIRAAPLSARRPMSAASARARESAEHFKPIIRRFEKQGPLLALDLSGCLIGREGLLRLSELMYAPGAQLLKVLDLSGNQLTNIGRQFDGVAALASAIQHHPHLTCLNLARNALYRQGAMSLARGLATNTTLQYLDVSRNNLRSSGVAAIADAISVDTNAGTSMAYLDMSENNATNFSAAPRGAMALAAAVRDHPSLTVLNLSHNRLERAALVSLALALEDNNVLVDLRLDDNGVDPQAAASLGDALKTNRSLTRLSLRNNSVRSTGCVSLAAALRLNKVVRHVDLRENYVSHNGRVALAAVLMPLAPSVAAAVKEMEMEEAINDIRQPELPPRKRGEIATGGGLASASWDSSDDEEDSQRTPMARKRFSGSNRTSVASSKSVPDASGGGGGGGVVESKAGEDVVEVEVEVGLGAGPEAKSTDDDGGAGGGGADADQLADEEYAAEIVDVDLDADELLLVAPFTKQEVLM